MIDLRGLLKAFFTEHLVAKLIAVLFAVVTVVLIDRRLNETVEWLNLGVPISIQDNITPLGPDQYRVILRPEPGVWIKRPQWATIRLRVEGPSKLRDEFRRSPVILIDAKREWAEPPGSDKWIVRQHSLAPDDLRVHGVEARNIQISLLKDYNVEVDLIEELGDVAVQLEPPPVPADLEYDATATVVQPSRVTLRGPRNVLDPFRKGAPVTMRLVDEPTYESGQTYRAELLPAVAARNISLAPGSAVKVKLGLKQREYDPLEIGELDVRWCLVDENYKNAVAGKVVIENQGNLTMTAKVTLEGLPDVVALYRDRQSLEELRRSLYVIADPNTQISETISGQSAPLIRLSVVGLPPGLGVRAIDPPNIPIRIERVN